MWIVTFEYAAIPAEEKNKTLNPDIAYNQTIPCFFLQDVSNLIIKRYDPNGRLPAKVTIEYKEEPVTSVT